MKVFLVLGCLFAFLSIAIGAFGAHGLEGKISAHSLQIYKTGVQYQMFQTAGIFLVALLLDKFGSSTTLTWAGWLMVLGIVLFSGSLYALSVTNVKIIGAITPIGGVLFLVSWVLVAISVLKS
ncbi:DUF423 domain-containing protein [Bacillus sp. RG28]|uniref:DUF423 domain-containing protein n=1 Tax=Gottfriedia endophytica TaxID=2820819 RepID=A0A940SJ13_9BACI|nr:DUF423 domain-containing protein [Gottfriedia endophytica]MBP0724996.1 DUF423 domain-containing protein [Gottfriedia endophytica]